MADNKGGALTLAGVLSWWVVAIIEGMGTGMSKDKSYTFRHSYFSHNFFFSTTFYLLLHWVTGIFCDFFFLQTGKPLSSAVGQ